jgi:iron complex transport system substrate-binding protein
VVAVDEYSTYPPDAPFTDLSGYTPNIEALASYDPDLIVVAFDPEGMITAAFGDDVPVASQFPATGREDVLAQIEQLGAMTGHLDEAVALSGDIAARWDIADQADANDASVYIEVDTTFYAASSNSFMGAALTGLGYTNIADAADANGGGFPQLSAEAILQASPDVIIVGTDYGTTVEDIAARPGWDSISALINDQVIVIPSDISSRWGPRCEGRPPPLPARPAPRRPLGAGGSHDCRSGDGVGSGGHHVPRRPGRRRMVDRVPVAGSKGGARPRRRSVAGGRGLRVSGGVSQPAG